MPNQRREYLLLLLLTLIWSTSFLLIKIGVHSIGPVTLTAIRMTIAAVVIGLWIGIKRIRLPINRRALGLYFVVGFLGNTLPFILISWGETRIDSSTAAMMMGIMPITTFILAHFFVPSEPLRMRKLLGISIGFTGLVALVGWSAVGGGDSVGQLAVLSAAISYSVTTIYVRIRATFSDLEMASGALIVGMLTSIPLAFILENPLTMPASAASISAAIALGIFPTALAALIYFRVIRTLGATVFSQLNYAVPVLGSFWGVIWLNEILQLRMLIALGLVLTGVYFVHTKSTLSTNS